LFQGKARNSRLPANRRGRSNLAMSASIARYLKDFGSPPPPQVMVEDMDLFAPDISEFAPQVEEPVDLDAIRAEAFEKGRGEATEEQQRRWDEERTALVDAHRAEIMALQERFEGELADMMAARLQEFAASTAQAVADQTANLLAPLIDEAIVVKTVADLAELVQAAILEGEVKTLTVKGPTEMFERLRARLGEDAVVIRHIEASDIDLTVDFGDASLVTRMSAWSASLKKVLG
jgi:hypothetical protein